MFKVLVFFATFVSDLQKNIFIFKHYEKETATFAPLPYCRH